MVRSTLASRLWSKIDQTGECWLWTGARYQNGYGSFKLSKEEGNDRAHRVMYRFVYGSIPDGKYVLHTCDVRHCVRPDHLYLGTQAQNISDMDTRRRRNISAMSRGIKHGHAKLTDDAVRDIRARYTGKYGNAILLAREYGVSANQIRLVGLRKAWQHVIDVPS